MYIMDREVFTLNEIYMIIRTLKKKKSLGF